MRSSACLNIVEPLCAGPMLSVILYLQNKGILKNVYICSMCSLPCNFVTYKRNKDKHSFRCMNKLCSAEKKYFSIRSGSVFKRYRFCLKTGLKLTWKWTLCTKDVDIRREVDIKKNF
ncbi:hypothetical protein GVAV_002766 [Gurleya vavrai]